MKLFYSVLGQYRLAFIRMLLLTLTSSLLGIGVLMFINSRLLSMQNQLSGVFWQFICILVVYLVLATLAQMSLTTLGHNFVYELRKQLLKQIMDTDLAQLQKLGKAKIMASLANDITSITYAFVRLPELIQGGVFVLCAGVYLFFLSPSLFAVTVLWIAATLVGGHWTVKRVYEHLRIIRIKNDELQQHYESVFDGHKELALNRYRAKKLYSEVFDHDAKIHRSHIVKADNYHAFAGNWTNVMMLGAVGLVFYLSIYQQWASLQDAITIAVTVLFIRTPLISAIGAFPMMLQGKVALKSIEQLQLHPFNHHFNHEASLFDNWQSISLKNVSYTYSQQQSKAPFSVGPIDLTLERGETVFLIGANGSGKSTLFMLLSGLYLPVSGGLWVDGEEVNSETRSSYRELFSSVFSDFYLFQHLLDGLGQDVENDLINEWLAHLQLSEKAKVENNLILNTQLSQGQRKRLALLIAVLEQRSILILDEWAADQDPYYRQIFYEQILPILKQKGYTVFAISHDDKYFQHADRIIQMDQGVLKSMPL